MAINDTLISTFVAEAEELLRSQLENKRKIIRNITKIIKPKLRKSGYQDISICLFPKKKKIRHAFDADLRSGILGFWNNGVIPDAYAGGLVTAQYSSFSIEDLCKVIKLLQRCETLY